MGEEKMKNFISFDLEFWYDSEFIEKIPDNNTEDFVLQGLEKALGLLNKHETKATFFVTGEVAEKYPEAIKRLHKAGHEIASHGYNHTMLNKFSKENFEKSIKMSKKIIEKITGKNPIGFRAPSWSISEKEFWVYEILEKLGFKYSSSLFPINTGLYGNSKFPIEPFNPLPKKKIIEIPIKPFKIFSMRIPFSGGVYFRLFPKSITKMFIKKMNKRGENALIYIHPWELCPEIPRVDTTFSGKIVTYYGLNKNEDKLDYILSNFKFYPLRDLIYLKGNKSL